METSQQFCLKWNNYHVNIASSFDALRVDEDFVDVTLACDGFQLKAHRMVLSACSPLFRQILKANPHPHPIVILRDVAQRHMELLLDFMYHGEVNVAQEQLPEFLKVAELLKVKGLADDKRAGAPGSNGQSGGVTTPSSSPPASAADEPPPKRLRPLPLALPLPAPVPPPAAHPAAPASHPPPPPPAAAAYEPAPVKRESPADSESEYEREREEAPLRPPRADDTGLLLPADVSPDVCELSQHSDTSRGHPVGPGPSSIPLEGNTDPLSRMLVCPHCPHLSSNYGKLKAHIGKVHFPVPANCADCGKVCKNKYALQVHKSKYHRRSWKMVAPTLFGGPNPLGGSPV